MENINALHEGDNSILRAAISYGEAGRSVIPLHAIRGGVCTCGKPACPSPGKHPVIAKWVKKASTDSDLIHGWFTGPQPRNIGLKTGGDFLVVDVDVPSKFEVFLAENNCTLPRTRKVKTSKGYHLYFRLPSGATIKNRAGIADCFDIRGEGGYVVAPSSVHVTGHVYTVEDSYELAEVPPFLLGLILPKGAAKKAPSVPALTHGATRYGKAALDDACRIIVKAPEGTRNATLNQQSFSIAQLVAGGQIDPEHAQSALMEAAEACGLSQQEARKTFSSGFEAGMNEQRKPEPRQRQSATRSPGTECEGTKYKSDIDAAMLKVADDPGAIFEPNVLSALRIIRAENPAQWQRIRAKIKAVGTVKMADLEYSTRLVRAEAKDSIVENTDPWPESVNLAQILNEMVLVLRRHVKASRETIHAAALWCVFTWFIQVVSFAPIANITAPTPRCGKTVLLTIMGKMCKRALFSSGITPSAMFRVLDSESPTMMIDEVDTFLRENDGARQVLNSGVERIGGYVLRCVGDDHSPTKFKTYGAKALCGIGAIADTLRDRSIPLELKRKLPHEKTVKARRADEQQLAIIRAKLARVAQDRAEDVRGYIPEEIDRLHDRANDCWEPLLQVAHIAGDRWRRRAILAAIALQGTEDDTPNSDVLLLHSIGVIFDIRRIDRIYSTDLLDALLADPELPWATWNRGKPLTTRQMADKLKAFGVKSKQLRIGESTGRKGYERTAFIDAWTRWPLPTESSTGLHVSNGAGSSDSESSTRPSPVDHPRSPQAFNSAGCRPVDDKNPPFNYAAPDGEEWF